MLEALTQQLKQSVPLSEEQAATAVAALIQESVAVTAKADFLTALALKGETINEIAAFARELRDKSIRPPVIGESVDVCGTGGDHLKTFNISTTVAFIVAAAGVPVAKHGNRALSSRSGAADVLSALGVKIDLTPDAISRCIHEAGIGFMFAPSHHPAMKHVGPTRVELGTRTIFNLLGPLSNPANVRRQMVGVFSKQWVEPLAYLGHVRGDERIVRASERCEEIFTSDKGHPPG